jgi:hypothetical protein
MDPNQALEDLRAAVAQARNLDPDPCPHVTQDLADAAEALDDWLSTGGHLPRAWDRMRTRPSDAVHIRELEHRPYPDPER